METCATMSKSCYPNTSSVPKIAKEGTNPEGLGGGSPSKAYVRYQECKEKVERESDREFLYSIGTLFKKATFLLMFRGYL